MSGKAIYSSFAKMNGLPGSKLSAFLRGEVFKTASQQGWKLALARGESKRLG